MRSIARLFAVVSCLAMSATMPAFAYDCFDQAAEYHQVNADVLRAIAIKESTSCRPVVTHNRNNSIDVGCMGINSIHFEELARYGIYPQDLLDQCKSIFVGAWHLKRKIRKYGETWTAVGAYHNEKPEIRDPYAEAVKRIWLRYYAGRK